MGGRRGRADGRMVNVMSGGRESVRDWINCVVVVVVVVQCMFAGSLSREIIYRIKCKKLGRIYIYIYELGSDINRCACTVFIKISVDVCVCVLGGGGDGDFGDGGVNCSV